MGACGKDIGVKLKWLTMATSGTFEQGNMIIMDYTQYDAIKMLKKIINGRERKALL